MRPHVTLFYYFNFNWNFDFWKYVLITILIFSNFVVNTGYNANWASSLTKPKHMKKLETFEDLLRES